ELFDRARPRNPVRSGVAGKLSALDAQRAVALCFGEVPGQLAEGAALGVGPEIVAVARQRRQQRLRLRRLAFPDLNETFQFCAHRVHPSTANCGAAGTILSRKRLET